MANFKAGSPLSLWKFTAPFPLCKRYEKILFLFNVSINDRIPTSLYVKFIIPNIYLQQWIVKNSVMLHVLTFSWLSYRILSQVFAKSLSFIR